MYKESALDHAKRMEQYNVEMYEYQQKMDAESAAAEKEETKKLFNLIERLVLTIREFCPTLELDSQSTTDGYIVYTPTESALLTSSTNNRLSIKWNNKIPQPASTEVDTRMTHIHFSWYKDKGWRWTAIEYAKDREINIVMSTAELSEYILHKYLYFIDGEDSEALDTENYLHEFKNAGAEKLLR